MADFLSNILVVFIISDGGNNLYSSFFNLHSEGVESILGPLGMSATCGLFCLPQVIVRMGNLVK
jgi:hypothetical protein